MKKGILLFLLSSIISMTCHAQELTVNAPKVVGLDETFQLVYTATAKVKDFNPPQISDFTVLAGPSSSTSISSSWVNGKSTSSYNVSYTYILQAKSVGTFTIPSASVKIGSKIYESGTLTIKVIKQATSSNQNGASNSSNSSGDDYSSKTSIGADDLFMTLSLSKTHVVKGEPIVATLKLFSRVNVSGISDVKLPTFNGFWNQDITSKQQISFQRETYKNQIYNAAVLKKYILYPQQTGKVYIDPAELVCQVQIQTHARTSRSIFDDFFDDGYSTIRKRVFTHKRLVNVSSLPSGQPGNFTGGVGEFTISQKLSTDKLKANEATSLLITISGKGNLNMIDEPKVSLPPDFEAYDVKKTDNFKTTSSGMNGSRTYEFPFIPRSSGDFTLEPVSFSYYSISKKKYVTLSTKAMDISVAKGEAGSGSLVVSGAMNKKLVKNLGEDIRFIETSGASLKYKAQMFVLSRLFNIMALSIIFVFFVLVWILDKFIERRKDITGMKTRKAKKMAKLRLKKAQVLLKQKLYSAFYEELHKAILGYLSDKLTIKMADLNRENVEDILLKQGAEKKVIDDLNSLLDACEFARYAPESGYTAMENHYNQAINIISEIES